MFCEKCGTSVDGMSVCPNCGAPVSGGAPYNAPNQPAAGYYQQAPQAPDYSNVPQGNSTKVLVLGILSLALSGIVGLILGIVGMSAAKSYIATYGDISNKVRIGRRLSLAGLIVSIVVIVLVILIVAIVIIAGLSYVNDNSYYSYYRYY